MQSIGQFCIPLLYTGAIFLGTLLPKLLVLHPPLKFWIGSPVLVHKKNNIQIMRYDNHVEKMMRTSIPVRGMHSFLWIVIRLRRIMNFDGGRNCLFINTTFLKLDVSLRSTHKKELDSHWGRKLEKKKTSHGKFAVLCMKTWRRNLTGEQITCGECTVVNSFDNQKTELIEKLSETNQNRKESSKSWTPIRKSLLLFRFLSLCWTNSIKVTTSLQNLT